MTPQIHADSTRYDRPYRPRLVAAANRAGGALLRAGLFDVPWRADALMEEASRATKLTDFGDPRFVEPLEVLLESIQKEAKLHAVGRLITKGRIVGALKTRLRAEALIAKHPEILDVRIDAPIVIAGLQRTGTTMLHRLLAQDPGLRALYSWEALSPVPEGKPTASRREDPRIRAAKLAENGLRYMAPEFFAIHPAEALAPEEEVVLLDLAFLSTVPEATLDVPTYSRWLETQDQTPAYEHLRRMLQILLWHTPKERWVLKTPHHLEWLDTLLAVFPDARIISTHRDPLKTMASFSSMITHGRGIFSDEVDPREVGAHWSRKIYRMIDRGMDTRDGPHAAQFLDVSYYDLLKNPMREVERIYDFVGRELTPAIRGRVDSSRGENKQHKYGRHSYRLEDFGLRAEDVERSVARYRTRFAIPHE